MRNRPAGLPGGPNDSTLSIAALLDLSDERDAWLRRVLAAERAGYDLGLADGIRQGRELAAAERDADWNRAAAGVIAIADPDSPEAHRSRNRRLIAARAGERRDAWQHWRQVWAEHSARSRDSRFIAEARSYPPLHPKRTHRHDVALLLHDRGLPGYGDAP